MQRLGEQTVFLLNFRTNNRSTTEPILPRVGKFQRVNDAHQRGLAAAIRAEQGHAFATLDSQ